MPRAVSKEITVHVGRHLQLVQAKKRAPRAIKEIKRIAAREMGTKDVRIDVKLNKHLWSKGIKSVPKRVRVKLQRKRSEDEDAEESFYTLVTYVPVTSFAGLGHTRSDE
eukprot:TRINITY_DN1731_c0_g1_i2.p1 TRINITY_DN1731_c0_g1~~TRINITY_DN1731_c0_g1_i2.p1  ORF type:complete len:109 (-),score=30.22 TRINITY_DN1731_c0_g1_i2:64-390(-)